MSDLIKGFIYVKDRRSGAVASANGYGASKIGSAEWVNQDGERAFYSLSPPLPLARWSVWP